MKDNKYLYFGYLLIIGVVFYLMNVFTPLYSDDWHYNFIFGSQTPINNIGDVLYSQYLHYLSFNGRFVPHFFVQLFDGILGKELFNVVNTFMFMCFLYLISFTLKNEFKNFYISTSLTLILIFFLVPGFSNCFLWMSGACNYLWVAVLLLLFNIVLNSNINNKSLYPLLFIFGIVCGWTNEALALGLGIGYFVYYIFKRKELDAKKVILLAGFYIGVGMLVFAPGSISRALDKSHVSTGLVGTLHNMGSALLLMDNIRFLPLLAIAIVVFQFLDKSKVKRAISSDIVFYVATITTFVFVLWTRHASGHSRFGFELFSLILLLKLASSIHWKKWFAHVSNILVFCFSLYALTFSYKNYNDYLNCVSQVLNTDSDIILTESAKYHGLIGRYIVHFTTPETSELYSPYNEWVSEHFGKEKLCFLPRVLYNEVMANPERFSSFDLNTQQPFYVKRINSNEVNRVILKLNQTDYKALPFYIKPIASHLARYAATEIESNSYSIVRINGNDYVIVNKHPMVDDRLKEIVVE